MDIQLMDTIEKHPIIPYNVLTDLPKFFNAIDNVLNLHYSSHSTDPTLTKILDSAAQLINRRINVSNLLTVMNIEPSSYKIYNLNSNNYDYSKIFIAPPDNVSIGKFSSLIPERKKIFIKRLNIWIKENQKASCISYPEIGAFIELITDRKASNSKISKQRSPRKKAQLLHDLRNDSSKFKFKEREEQTERLKNNGLTLLERIKLKEKLKNQQSQIETPEMKYQNYLNGKSIPIYNIIYQLNNHDLQDTKSKSYSIKKLSTIINDSLNYPICNDEIFDILKLIEKKINNETFKILTINELSVLKILKLDRNKDLNLLK